MEITATVPDHAPLPDSRRPAGTHCYQPKPSMLPTSLFSSITSADTAELRQRLITFVAEVLGEEDM